MGKIHSQHYVHIPFVMISLTGTVAVYPIFVSFDLFPDSFELEITSGILFFSSVKGPDLLHE